MENSYLQLWQRCGVLAPAAVGALIGASMGSIFPLNIAILLALTTGVISLFLWHKRLLLATFLFFCATFLLWAVFGVAHLSNNFLHANDHNKKYWVVGQVSEIKQTNKTAQLILDHSKVYNAINSPKKVRISTFWSRIKDVEIGEWLAVEAKLFRPGTPGFNGQFNAQRYARSLGLGATGHVMGEIHKTSKPMGQGQLSTFSYKLSKLRQFLANNFYQKGGETAASGVAAALLTGIRSYIPPETAQSFRTSGLAHLLAISGLHLGLVAGFFFFSVRKFLSLFPFISLQLNNKKIAAIAGLMAAFGYMLLAGATIPTVRAFFMLGLIFIAVLAGRRRIGLRALCMAVLIILTLWPESVLSASFQMSFAATLALILWAELKEKPTYSHLKLMQGIGYFQIVWACGVVAGLATMAFAAWHFQMVSLTGFFLNLLAIPLTAFWVLPAGVVSLLLTPIGLEFWPIYITEQGVNTLINISELGQNTVFAGIYFPRILWPILLFGCGMALWSYFSSRWKLFGISSVALVGLLLLAPFFPPFFNFVLLGEETVLLQKKGKEFYIAAPPKKREEKYLLKSFAQYHGLRLTPHMCKEESCLFKLAEKEILVLPPHIHPTLEECALADVIITTQPSTCPKSVVRGKKTELLRL